MSVVETCYEKSIELLRKNSTNLGFKASLSWYKAIWGRDGAITCFGANLTDDKKLLDASRRTLETLKKFQSVMGQIPNAYILEKVVPTYINKKSVSMYAVDATPLWIIAVHSYFKATKDEKFLAEFSPAIEKAVTWLMYQITDDSYLISSSQSTDWMDSSIQRHGRVLYNNCLFYQAIKCAHELGIEVKCKYNNPDKIKENINLLFWPEKKGKNMFPPTWHRGFFDEAILQEKNHYFGYLSYETYDNRCDVFANCLAILYGIADKEKRKKILDYFKARKISDPYPVRVLDPPIFFPDPTWNPKVGLYRLRRWQNLPYWYHNGAVWPFVGGFYVLTLLKSGMKKEARKELERLAESNKIGKHKWEFNEWLHGKTGEPMGVPFQSWSAATYIMAYKAVKEKDKSFL